MAYLQNNLSLIQSRNQAILDSTHNGILVVNQLGEVTLINEAGERLLGVNREEALGKPVLDLFPTSGLVNVLRTGRPEIGMKIVIKGRTLISNRSPLVYSGLVVGAIAVFQDITELEQISSELQTVQALNRELNAVIEYSFDGIMITDPNGIGVRINKALARLTGLDESYFIGKPIQNLFSGGVFQYESITIKALREGRPVTGIQKVTTTGKEVMVTGVPVFDAGGKITMVLTNVRDISELVMLQEQLRESVMKTTRYQDELNQIMLEKMQHDHVVAKSPGMLKALDLALRVARTDATVLITGESGAGKEVVARIIHNNSSRREQGSFIKINCGAIPETLLESELFGYETGAFTGARKEGKVGLFEVAAKGTLLLDEIGELSPGLQVKLLRVIQEQEIYRVGGTKPIKLDLRIIAATNRNLEELIRQGRFREDLFYRLNVVPIAVPSLRERKSDIIPLALHFLEKYNKKYGTAKRFEPQALSILENYTWPGNVRELENCVERLLVLSDNNTVSGELIKAQLFRDQERKAAPITVNSILPLREAQEIVERELIYRALEEYRTVRSAAKVLGIAHSNVIRKSERYGLKSSNPSH
ncbi:MAG: sigma 54-interacting transcriptional regulator [Peptococcaceae bacterium]|nr:sigma 54-interacting transcriptional regulator [Peptococcaceae bacterium]